LWETFREQTDRHGVTLLVSSHVMDEASHCDRLLLLRDGKLIAQDTPDALLAATGGASMDDAFLRLVEKKEAVA
jgi:ABC-type multidrug transport system ATPase subunit